MRAAGVIALVAAAALAVAAGGTIAVQVGRIADTSAPAGVPATTPEQGAPERVTIPAIGVDAQLVPVGLKGDGAVETPRFGLAGWYEPGPRPGDRGAAVLLAHVDSKADGPDVFYRLHELKRGDRVRVGYHDATATFVVTDTEQVDKSALPTKRIWAATKRPVLRLITCGGEFDPAARSYRDNVIVYADRLG
ncbi:MAG TPA: class F sortase [Actinophytocola sp.]|jgi:LPXTG-site transpeptidase (sortase) family protein|uniref:class F sortase n=1 Tax=Actinophytocola sp. TaxID=1872138 RepID=UPI002F955588